MLGRFSELGKLGVSEAKSVKSAKRSIGDAHNKNKDPKKRRRSLFTNFTSIPRKNDERQKRLSYSIHRDVQISDFSSSSEDENEGVKDKSKLKSTLLERGNSSLVAGRTNVVLSQKRRRESAPLYLRRQEEFIHWSDSDNEIDCSSLDKNSKLRAVETEALDIGKFESPKKQTGHASSDAGFRDSQISIEDSTQTPLSTFDGKQADEDGQEFKAKLFDSSKKRRSKYVSGGLAEQLRKLNAREKSDMAFWQHSVNIMKKDIPKDIDELDENSFILKILSSEYKFSLVVITCETLESIPKMVHLILHEERLKNMEVKKDCLIKVFPPFKIVNFPCSGGSVILCAYFFQEVKNYPEGIQEGRVFDFLKNETIEPQSQCSNQANLRGVTDDVLTAQHCQEKASANFGTDISTCCFSKPSSFLARVVKLVVFRANSQPVFSSVSNDSLINVFTRKAKNDVEEELLEILFILNDANGNIGLLRYPFKRYKESGLENVSPLLRNTLAFGNFYLKDVTNSSFFPNLLPFIKQNTKDEEPKSILQIPLHVFSYTSESTISEYKTMVLNEENLEQPQHIANCGQFQRVSFFALCICMLPGIYCEEPTANSKQFSLALMKLQSKNDKSIPYSSTDNKSEIYILEKMPDCYIPDIVTKCLLDDGQILFFKDILEDPNKSKHIADMFTEICLVEMSNLSSDSQSLAAFGRIQINETTMSCLKNEYNYSFENLSANSKVHAVVKTEGVIIGINEDTAMFWAVCSKCGEEGKNAARQKVFHCSCCNEDVERQLCVQLDVLVRCKDLESTAVTIRMLEKTVFDYLPMQITEEFNGYDIDFIMGKKFGPKICFVVSKHEVVSNQDVPVNSIDLKEVDINKCLESLLLES